MFVRLRDVRSLQQVRKAVETLMEHRPEDHVSQHRLEAPIQEKRGIYWLDEQGAWVEMADSPGQGVIKVVMDDILGEFVTDDGMVVPPLHTPAQGLELDPQVYSGTPTISGTGVPYQNVGSLAEDGMSGDDIRHWYPGVPDEAIEGAALLYRQVQARRAA